MTLFVPHPTSQREDLESIASFLGISVTGQDMEHITHASSSVLGRIKNGGESDRHGPHLSRVAAFCRELREALEDMTGRETPQIGTMTAWLHSGAVQTTNHGVQTPWAVFANEEMTMEALNELRRAIG